MPNLYGIPGGPATVEKTGGQPSDPLDSALQSLLSQLQLPQAQPPEPISPAKRVLSGLADALMARAQVLAGGQPQGAGAAERLQKEQKAKEAQAREVNQANRQTRNTVAIEGYKEQVRQREEQAKAKEIADRQAAAQAAIEARAQANDERDAQLRDHAEALRQWSDLLDKPGFRPPISEDLSKLTMQRLNEIKSAWIRQNGGGVNSDPLAVLDTLAKLIKNQTVDSATLPLPGGGSVTARKPAAASTANQPEAPVTPTQRTALQRAGIPETPGMTNIEAQNLIAAENKVKEDERDKRLNALTDRGTKVRDDIVSMMNVRENARLAIDLIERNKNTMATGGKGYGSAGYIPYYLLPDAAQATRIELNRRITQANTSVRTAGIGKNMTAVELRLMEPMLTDITDTDEKKLDNLRGMIETADKVIEDRRQRKGLSEDDINFLRLGQPTQPSETPTGAKTLGTSGGRKVIEAP